MSAALVYFTAASKSDAVKIGATIVEERLAACVNVLGEITSIYRWEGAIQQEGEVAAIAKTSESTLAALIDRIKDLHAYDCPCVISARIDAGNPEFLAWIAAETGEENED